MKAALLTVALGCCGILLATGCGASHQRSAGNFPIVVAHPQIQTSGLTNITLKADEATLLAGSRVAFVTTGTDSCVWWPKRLTFLDAETVQIDMRVNGVVARCSSGAVPFPIAVKIDPRIVDVHQPLTIRLAYEVLLPGEDTARHWERTETALAVSGS